MKIVDVQISAKNPGFFLFFTLSECEITEKQFQERGKLNSLTREFRGEQVYIKGQMETDDPLTTISWLLDAEKK